ncbi:MAG: NlpC/P60 family protein [Pseudomonadota bacterium]
MQKPDPRRHPYCDKVAASYLRGQVEAERFSDGISMRVAATVTDIVAKPGASSRTSQALFGEVFIVYDETDGWAWGQLKTDGYVGWVRRQSIEPIAETPPTHMVSVPLTWATADSIKVIGRGPLLMGAQLSVASPDRPVKGSSARFVDTDAGTVPSGHISALQQSSSGWVETALRFLGFPYVWGGRSALGIDCSALVQLSLQQAGIAAPRDSDMQEAELGQSIDRREGIEPGDLVFWPGHVGIALPGEVLLHANAFTMQTSTEPLSDVESRIGVATKIKRLQ